MAKENNMFKIKHIASGQYVKKGGRGYDAMELSDKGKTWNSIGALKGHIRCNQTHYSKYGSDYQVVELKVTEADACKFSEILKVMDDAKMTKEEKRKKSRERGILRRKKAERAKLDKEIKEIESK